MADSRLEQHPKKDDARLAVSGAEIVLLILLVIVGIGIRMWVERGFHVFVRETSEARMLERYHIFEQQDELSRVLNERQALQSQLTNAQFEQLTQSTTMSTIAATNTGVEKYADGTSAPISFSTDAIRTYKDARMKELIASQLIASLNDKLKSYGSQIEAARMRLEDAKEAANDRLLLYRAGYSLLQRIAILVVTLLLGLLFFILVRAFVPAKARAIMWTTQSQLPLRVVIGALAILLAFQAFDLAGAALVAIVALWIILPRIPWPAQPSAGSEAETK
jgi:hypothetical protein